MFQSACTLNTQTNGRQLTWIGSRTLQKVNVLGYYGTHKLRWNCVKGKLHTLGSVLARTRRRLLPGHYAQIKHKTRCRCRTQNTPNLQNAQTLLNTHTHWTTCADLKTQRCHWELLSQPGLWGRTPQQVSVVSNTTSVHVCLMLFLGLFGGSLEVNSVLVPNFSHEQIVCVITCYYFDCHDTVGGGQFSHSWACACSLQAL